MRCIFKVYERGIDLFQYPVAFELWNIYLSKFIDRYVSDLGRNESGGRALMIIPFLSGRLEARTY